MHANVNLTDTHTDRQIHTQDNYRNPCACAPRVNNSLCVVWWRLIIHCTYSNDGKQLISDTYVRGHISITLTLTWNSLYLIPKHVPFIVQQHYNIMYMYIRVGGFCPTHSSSCCPGWCCFVLHFPDFHVRKM